MRALYRQAQFYQQRKRMADAMRAYRRGVQVGEELVGELPTAAHRHYLAGCANNLGAILLSGSPKEAGPPLKRAGALAEQLVAEYPSRSVYRWLLAMNLSAQADRLLRLGDTAEAEAPLRRAVPLLRQLLADSPSDEGRRYLRYALQRLARVVRDRDPAEAERLSREAAALMK
jgi:hypothetical protein